MPMWVIVWLTISAIIQTYDACYVLLGPLSHDGGPLAGLWPGHVFYGSFDQRYSQFDAFGSAQSWANLLEVIVIVWALATRSVVRCRRRPDRDGRDVLEDRDLLPGRDLGGLEMTRQSLEAATSSASSWSPCCRICSGSSSRSRDHGDARWAVPRPLGERRRQRGVTRSSPRPRAAGRSCRPRARPRSRIGCAADRGRRAGTAAA